MLVPPRVGLARRGASADGDDLIDRAEGQGAAVRLGRAGGGVPAGGRVLRQAFGAMAERAADGVYLLR